MKKRAYILLVLLCVTLVSESQRSPKPFRPSYEMPKSSYERPEYRERSWKEQSHTYDGNNKYHDGNRAIEIATSPKYRSAFSNFEKITPEKTKAQWEFLEELLSPEEFKKLKDGYTNTYQIAYVNGGYEILHYGEIANGDFDITEHNNELVIKALPPLHAESITIMFDQTLCKSGIKINAENITLKILAKSGNTYNVEKVIIDDNQMCYMATLRDGIWFEPTSSDDKLIVRNLDQKFDKDLVKIVSIVSDTKTNEKLKTEFGKAALTSKSKTDILNLLTVQQEGSTVFIVGHHENGRFIASDEKGNNSFELTASELDYLSKKVNINIFPLGCKTAFSNFSTGANIELNSLQLVQALCKAIQSSNTFGNVLQAITKIDPALRFLVKDNSFGSVNVAVYKDVHWKIEPHGGKQSIDSSSVIRTIKRPESAIEVKKVAEGLLRSILDSSNLDPIASLGVKSSSSAGKADKPRTIMSYLPLGSLSLFLLFVLAHCIDYIKERKKLTLPNVKKIFIDSLAVTLLFVFVFLVMELFIFFLNW